MPTSARPASRTPRRGPAGRPGARRPAARRRTPGRRPSRQVPPVEHHRQHVLAEPVDPLQRRPCPPRRTGWPPPRTAPAGERPLHRAVAAHRQAGDEGVLAPPGHPEEARTTSGSSWDRNVQYRPPCACRGRSCDAPAASPRPARAARRTARSRCAAARCVVVAQAVQQVQHRVSAGARLAGHPDLAVGRLRQHHRHRRARGRARRRRSRSGSAPWPPSEARWTARVGERRRVHTYRFATITAPGGLFVQARQWDRQTMTADGSYVYRQSWEQERARLAGLSAQFDPGTTRHLRTIGVGPGGAAGRSAQVRAASPPGWRTRSASRGTCWPPTSTPGSSTSWPVATCRCVSTTTPTRRCRTASSTWCTRARCWSTCRPGGARCAGWSARSDPVACSSSRTWSSVAVTSR